MSEALQLPGVVDIITAADIPGKKVQTSCGYDEELLAESQVASFIHQMYVCSSVCVSPLHIEM